MHRSIPIERDIIVSVPENYSNTKRGSFFEKFCADILKKQSYEIIGIEIRRTGMEVDIEAKHKPSSKKVYIECKFINQKKINANIVDLCFAQATRAKMKSISLFSTTPLGKDAQGAYQDYVNMEDCEYSFYGSQEIIDALVACGKVHEINDLTLPANITHASLLVHPEQPMVWLFQEVHEGVPKSLSAYSPNEAIDCERIRKILDSEKMFEGLNIREFDSNTSTKGSHDSVLSIKEVVSGIVVADDIMDYKPCRPTDFVGRDAIQKEIWDYLESVRDNTNNTRLLSIIGSSGSGKSSLVAYLSNRFRNVKWKNKFYLCPVDVRSARGARFVSEAVVKAFNLAIKDKFIEVDGDFYIENINDITSGGKFAECTDYLKKNEKVLVIFFDQFEEVFMKEELFGLFRAFERFALDTSSEEKNFVVGFSWRSGITLGDENPAYSMWSKLSDFRIDKKLTKFDIKDSSKLITGFEKKFGIKLNKSLRGRLIQQAQGLPWLLKKLCIHLFKKVKEGVSQEQLLISQLQIRTLFDEDLDRPDKEISCLRFVATNSPVDQYETTKEYGQQTVSNLLSDRLLIKTGEKISVYWDVFRDYLKTGEAPIVPWSYMPAASLNMSLSLLATINDSSKASLESLLSNTSYSKGTLTNIIMDLQSFSLIEKDANDIYKLSCPIDQVAEVARSHLKGHVVYAKALNALKEVTSASIPLEKFNGLIGSVYANKEGKIPQGYAARITSWLQYSGLIGKGMNKIHIFQSDEYSPEFGSSGKRNCLFLAATTPEKSLILIRELLSVKQMSIEDQGIRKARNPVSDLVSLGICTKGENSEILLSRGVKTDKDPEHILVLAVTKADTIVMLNELIIQFGTDKEKLALELRARLGKSWKESSSKRYLSGLLRYRDYSDNYLSSSS